MVGLVWGFCIQTEVLLWQVLLWPSKWHRELLTFLTTFNYDIINTL